MQIRRNVQSAPSTRPQDLFYRRHSNSLLVWHGKTRILWHSWSPTTATRTCCTLSPRRGCCNSGGHMLTRSSCFFCCMSCSSSAVWLGSWLVSSKEGGCVCLFICLLVFMCLLPGVCTCNIFQMFSYAQVLLFNSWFPFFSNWNQIKLRCNFTKDAFIRTSEEYDSLSNDTKAQFDECNASLPTKSALWIALILAMCFMLFLESNFLFRVG